MVLKTDGDKGELFATIQSSNGIEKYECAFDACTNPVCTCGVVYLTLKPIQHGTENEKSSAIQQKVIT